ncbi:hypothetical protein GCM10023149_24990 [Mucilaginibacter gynuensis]|uniref:histidine kinase n=2 Tax=Mucilaginibacter gynuensis TaxID=1302236 RepID=A0ABP8GGY9_9SPHI
MAKKLNIRNDHAESLLEKIDHQVIEMTAVLDNMLDMSLVFSGKIVLRKTCFKINDLLTEILDDYSQYFRSHHFTMVSNYECSVYADRGKIKQVIVNLISNAVKYSSQQSEVNVSCKYANEVITLAVVDQGIGISQENQQKLFGRYFRGDCDQVRLKKGYGIGLYIAKEIVCHHGGQIWVKSKEGSGSTFFISLPVPLPFTLT